MPSRKRNSILELSEAAEEQLAKLKALSERAESGDRAARGELRKVLREASPAVVAEAAEIARKGQWALIKRAAHGEPLAEEALVRQLDLMRLEIGGENPSTLESMLTEKIVGTWMLTELLDLLTAARLVPGKDVVRLPHREHEFYLKWQEKAHRRLQSAIRTLAQARRLQSGSPNAQTNVQVNIGASGGIKE